MALQEDITSAIPYGIDFRKVKEIIEKAAVSVPYCIKPDPLHEVECGITGFGNFGINVELVVWVDPIELMEPYRLEASFLNAINDACVANGIVMPYRPTVLLSLRLRRRSHSMLRFPEPPLLYLPICKHLRPQVMLEQQTLL